MFICFCFLISTADREEGKGLGIHMGDLLKVGRGRRPRAGCPWEAFLLREGEISDLGENSQETHCLLTELHCCTGPTVKWQLCLVSLSGYTEYRGVSSSRQNWKKNIFPSKHDSKYLRNFSSKLIVFKQTKANSFSMHCLGSPEIHEQVGSC